MSRDGREREGGMGERKKRGGGRDGKAGGMEGIKMWFHYCWCVHLSSTRLRLCSAAAVGGAARRIVERKRSRDYGSKMTVRPDGTRLVLSAPLRVGADADVMAGTPVCMGSTV